LNFISLYITLTIALTFNTQLPTTNKAILTFDDGPRTITTPKILDILKKHNVKAVFCWPSSNFNSSRIKIARRAIKEGHTLCNHSVSHPVFSRISPRHQKYQIWRAQFIYIKYLNYKPKYFRPPAGIITQTMRSELNGGGLKLLMWHPTLNSEDWKRSTTEQQIYSKVIKGWLRLKRQGKTGIILFHDTNRKTANVLDRIITRIKTTP